MAGSSGKKKGSPEYEETHSRIAIAALNLLTTSGIHDCGVRSVAEAANVSTATLRAHFPGGKGQLLIAAVEQMPEFTAADPLTGTARQRVDAYVASAMQFAPRISALLAEAIL
jgi:AcrR family transcriptional regulator